MERWILIFNCQTYGLAHSLQMLGEAITVEPVDTGQYRSHLAHYNASFGDYARVLVSPEAEDAPGADFTLAPRVDKIPAIGFDAYHPDLTYLFSGGAVLNGPLDAYHSMIAYAAHFRGRTVAQTIPLFGASFYKACGYLDRWVAERDHLIWYCNHFGLDVSRAIRRWGRASSFMYSTNHPKIHVLHDVARLFLKREGYAVRESGLLPHDNLVNSSCFPVYPEIGETLGVPGSYDFKRCNQYTQIGLHQFVEECFAVYDQHPRGSLTLTDKMQKTFDHVVTLM